MEENSVLDWCFKMMAKELKKEEFKEHVLKPLVKSVLIYVLPYLFFVFGIQVVLLILAMYLFKNISS
jgi:hypothetical protein